MGSMNKVFLMGHLTRDLELRHTPGGLAVADMGLAVSDSYKSKDGKVVESVCFVDVVVWGKTAEACTQYLGKGSPALVEGRLQLDQWQTEDGQKRSKVRVRADRVHFLGKPRNSTDASRSAGEPALAGVGVGDDDGMPL